MAREEGKGGGWGLAWMPGTPDHVHDMEYISVRKRVLYTGLGPKKTKCFAFLACFLCLLSHVSYTMVLSSNPRYRKTVPPR